MRPIWKLLGWTVVGALAALYLVLLTTGPRGLPALEKNQQRIAEMRQQAAELIRDNDRRRQRIRLLREDRDELDLKIRERLRLRKPGTAELFYPDAPVEGSPRKP
jgi:cell division protein FtsB